MIDNIVENIEWLGHASLLIKLGDKRIYVDPWKIKDDSQKADIILVSHSHFDHYSEDDIKRISSSKTHIFSSDDVISKTSLKNKKTIKPFQSVKIDDIVITGFPSYNVNKEFHPKKNNWLGFIIEYKGVKIYIAGDTDFTEEMRKIKADIVIIPIGGTYTMDENESAEFVNLVKPAVAIPIHWGDIVGSKKNLESFLKNVKQPVKVVVKQHQP